jgi:hypothetical protein
VSAVEVDENGEVIEPTPEPVEEPTENDEPGPADDDLEVEGEPEPEPEPAQDAGPSLEAIHKLGKRFETYAKAVGDTYEEDGQFLFPCPLCPDNHKGFIDMRYAGKVPDEIAAEVHTYLTASAVGSFEQDPGTKTCPVCAGKTQVKTGAISGKWITRTCPNCGGYGFMPPPSNAVGALGATGNGGVVPVDNVELVPQEDVDEWGEPRTLPDGTLNSNYGMMPNRKTIHPVYGVTANLTAQAVA